MVRLIVWCVLLLLVLPAQGQQSHITTLDLTTQRLADSETYQALNAAIVPPMRIPEMLAEYVTGDILNVDVLDTTAGVMVRVPVRLAAISHRVLLWVDSASGIDIDDAEAFAQLVSQQIVPPVDALWRAERSLSPIHLILTQQVGPGLDAYYTYIGSDELAAPRLVFNAMRFQDLDDSVLRSRTAHEYQHHLRRQLAPGTAAWLDEGFSTFTERVLGLDDHPGLDSAFTQSPDTPLTQWGGTLADYGASLSFVQHLDDRYGRDIVIALSRAQGHSYQTLSRTLDRYTDTDVDTLLADWVLDSLLRGAPSRLIGEDASRMPYRTQGSLLQTGSRLFRIDAPTGNTLTLQLTQPEQVGMLPDGDCENRFMMAVVNDYSQPSQTVSLDLRGLEDVTLTYDLWYDLEAGWDYAYVSVSVDGATWSDLSTGRMQIDNPYGRARGAGYTGTSNAWVSDAVDLSAYQGQQIQVRFQMVTDESVTRWGIALDNVTLNGEPLDSSTWQREGWAHLSDCLPQRTWVHIVQRVGNTDSVTRLLTDGPLTQTIALLPNVESVLVALTPITPYTFMHLPYSLTLHTE